MISKHTEYENNVFVNCPFDSKYYELLRTLIFSVVYFGFNPRIALESSDSGSSRLDKIVSIIQESKYSIHDISRLQAKNIDEYYRLNMPFELGIDFGLRRFNKNFSDKRSLILETEKYEYMKAISDINGMDIKNHEDIPEKLIACLRSWFSETAGLRNLNSSDKIYADFIQFNTDLYKNTMYKYAGSHTSTEAEGFAKTEIENLTVPEYIDEIKEWIAINNND